MQLKCSFNPVNSSQGNDTDGSLPSILVHGVVHNLHISKTGLMVSEVIRMGR